MKKIMTLVAVLGMALTTFGQASSEMDKVICGEMNDIWIEMKVNKLLVAIPQYKDTYEMVIRVRIDYEYEYHKAFMGGFTEDQTALEVFKSIGYTKAKIIYNDRIKYFTF